MRRRICISGSGILSSIGIGRIPYWDGLEAGRNGIGAIDLFDHSGLDCSLGAQLADIDLTALIDSKGLRYVDRVSRFVIAATNLAIEDAGLSLEELDPDKRGIVLGTAFGGLTSLHDFNRERLEEGPKWVSPMKFPNTPINALSYQIPIRYQMRLVNVTLSAGMTSSLEAIRYASLILQRAPDAILLSGGVDELSYLAYHSSYFMQELAGISGVELSCPLDRRRNGYVLGEGCGLMVLETLEALEQRNGQGLAEIEGFGSAFTLPQAPLSAKTEGIVASLQAALEHAQLQPDDIDYIALSANSTLDVDRSEANALIQVFGARPLPASAIKSMLGEAFGASGSLQIGAAILALNRGIVPPTINLEDPDPACAGAGVAATSRRCEVNHALVVSIDRYGAVATMILGRL